MHHSILDVLVSKRSFFFLDRIQGSKLVGCVYEETHRKTPTKNMIFQLFSVPNSPATPNLTSYILQHHVRYLKEEPLLSMISFVFDTNAFKT